MTSGFNALLNRLQMSEDLKLHRKIVYRVLEGWEDGFVSCVSMTSVYLKSICKRPHENTLASSPKLPKPAYIPKITRITQKPPEATLMVSKQFVFTTSNLSHRLRVLTYICFYLYEVLHLMCEYITHSE